MRKTLYTDLTHVFCPAEPTKNCPRGQPWDNSALHSKINSCKDPRGSLIWKGNLLGTRLSATLALSDPKKPKTLVQFFHSALSLLPCLFTEALLIHQRLAVPMHPWPSHEILVGAQQGSQGGYSRNQSLWVSTCASAWWLTLQRQFRVSQCGVWEDTLHVFWTCAICEVHSSTKGLLISKVRGLWLLAWGWGDDRGLRTWGFGFRIWSLDWKIVCSFPVISKRKTFLESKSQ